ncbi:undecaprenyl/decaprenyl-phosphate alpha-N-acetylglucosaminyl 1-phosphate transferase [Bacillus shivajii]|uniref:glycosyltransferase family 4 protein n=1 Tax=Bacillus shivajii TaxID=1983719 RepID=UPI001CFB76C5|nr:MraY family glycosyltransferase [Bacillus shivajii]UCZ52711.1 undecaprenyl/decaprenyl-phosphate alpha-N-acetylglucosaminyl 1-phosphate transferase [Bacillus shivajii]
MSLIFAIIMTLILSLTITPLIIKVALKLGAVDQPSSRKVHQKAMPRLGGLAIFLSFVAGISFIHPYDPFHYSIIVGATIIIAIGILDDFIELSAKMKVVGQLVAALTVVAYGGLKIEFVNLPFGGVWEFGIFSIPITIFWILTLTNAINLIDGLDGLAGGVSAIGLVSLSVMAFMMGNEYVMIVSLILLFSVLGFLVFNFYPAKIFMGDTGALFLGYMFAVLSILGFKNVTVISFIIPILILGLPLSDTIFAIIRRVKNKTPFYVPDRSHIHHCFLDLGFSHRQTVLIIYGVSAFFGSIAILFSMATITGAIIIALLVILMIEVFAEALGLVSNNYRPLLNFWSHNIVKNKRKDTI